jgi:roadblock/LC7 domain-containing protein
MHIPRISFRGTLARRLSRRTTLKSAAGTGIAATAGVIVDRARAAFAADQVELAAGDGLTATVGDLRTRRGLRGKSPARRAPERLTDCDGVVLAVEWAPDGTLLDFQTRADISRDLAASAAQYGAAVSVMAPGLAEGYASATGFAWAPFRAVVVCGGDWAAVVGSDNRGVWVNAAEADFNQLIATLGVGRQPPAI